MTDRDIMQQALEALEYPGPSWPEARQKAAFALRERLAHCERCGKKLGEPDHIHTCSPHTDHIVDANKMVPLTDEEIRHFWREATMKPKYTSEFVEDFARAIEAAHGITGET